VTDARTDPRLFSRDPAERRAFLSEVGEGIAYFIPPELRSRFQFLAEMTPSATVERAGSAARSAVQPGLTAGERVGNVGAMLSEMAGVAAPFAVAPRAAMPAAEAAQEAFLGFSVPARAAAETAFERLNQPGPMPETLYSNPPFDHAAFIRQHFGPERKAAADAQRLREDLDANDQLRAERGLPPLNPPPRSADPSPRDFGFTQDNPGGDWLQNKQDRADQAMAESGRGLGRRGITGSVTGTMGMDTDMFLPTDRLSGLTGLMDENRRPGDPRFDALLTRVREEGFDPNQAGNKIVIAVNHRGEPFVLEGNTRIAVARELGIPNVRAEVRYWNGAEEVEGPFAPNNVARIAARGPSGSRPEGFAQGGAIRGGIGSLSGVARGMFRA
jgi:hypothetical protein